jgi:hypothetical protein
MAAMEVWGGSLHLTFRLLPEPSNNLRPFLDSEGLYEEEVLWRLPYDVARAHGGAGQPDPRRYRDGRHVYQTAGLLYEDEAGLIRITELGGATLRWLPMLTQKNAVILGRHAAYALTAAQLVNPTRAGQKYDPALRVFPFSFIWRAMLDLDDRISSDELNRALFKVRNEDELSRAIGAIALARREDNVDVMGEETISGPVKNDRIIPWISIASYGWILISNKEAGSDYYTIPNTTRALLREASQLRRRHVDFDSVGDYVKHLSRAAALPLDLR